MATEEVEAKPISPDVLETLDRASQWFGAAVAPLVQKVEQARDIAADLEAELVTVQRHLQAVLPLAATTWVQDRAKIEAARAYLDALG